MRRHEIDWSAVRRVLVVKLRSIGDTVLATPSLIALRRFLPNAQIDILLEDWVAPLLDGFDAVNNVLPVATSRSFLPEPHTDILLGNRLARLLGRDAANNVVSIRHSPSGPLGRAGSLAGRAILGRSLRETGYDVAFNLHGGTTATFFVRASGARHRVGLASYQYSFLYNHLLSSPAEFWERDVMHSAEQQLALLGFVGVPVNDRPRSRLSVTDTGRTARVRECDGDKPFALMHPSSAFFTKQWPIANFVRTADRLAEIGLKTIAISSTDESKVLVDLERESKVPVTLFDNLTLPEITALASRARIFVGNDSGIAHIAGAVNTPSVVIFGSSNRDHWRPWTDAPNEIVYEEFACQPCPGYECKEFGEPRCILSVQPQSVFDAIDRVLAAV